jgi:hypothetical protein
MARMIVQVRIQRPRELESIDKVKPRSGEGSPEELFFGVLIVADERVTGAPWKPIQ